MGFIDILKIINPPTIIDKNPCQNHINGPLVESFVKHVFCKNVKPVLGSIVKIDLALSQIEHTGVYVGNNQIVELNGDGRIRKISKNEFINGSMLRTGISSYIACNLEGEPLGNPEIANRALEIVGKKRNYNLILDNCHQFVAGAITGKFENSDNFFTFLEKTIKTEMNYGNKINWLVWK